MSINLLESLGIDPEQIEAIGQAEIEVTTAESNSNMFVRWASCQKDRTSNK